MGFAAKWRECGGDDGEGVEWEGVGCGEFIFIFTWFPFRVEVIWREKRRGDEDECISMTTC